MHHNYIGGLLEHTYECLDIAKTAVGVVVVGGVVFVRIKNIK